MEGFVARTSTHDNEDGGEEMPSIFAFSSLSSPITRRPFSSSSSPDKFLVCNGDETFSAVDGRLIVRSPSFSSSTRSGVDVDVIPPDALITGKDEVFSKASHELIFGRSDQPPVHPAVTGAISSRSAAAAANAAASTPRRPEFDLESNYDWTEEEEGFGDFDVDEDGDVNIWDAASSSSSCASASATSSSSSNRSFSSPDLPMTTTEKSKLSCGKRLHDLEILTPETEKMPPPSLTPLTRKLYVIPFFFQN